MAATTEGGQLPACVHVEITHGGMADTMIVMSHRPLPTVYADETHNTGENLNDSDQPVFVVAGVHLDDAFATELVEKVQSTLQRGAGEPKYSRLSRRPKSRSTLIEIFSELPDNNVKVFVANKKFMTVSKIVDLGIESLAYSEGYNMHADESARALAHLVSLTAHTVGDGSKFDTVLSLFVLAILKQDTSTAYQYQAAAEEYLGTVSSEAVHLLETALLPADGWLAALVKARQTGEHPDTLDPAIPALVALCWEFSDLLGPIHLIHDDSSVISRNRDTLLKVGELPDPADPTRRMKPIGVAEISFASSHSVPQLIVADWIAGAARDSAMSKLDPPRKPKDEHLDQIVESWLAAPPLWPDAGWLSEKLGVPLTNSE